MTLRPRLLLLATLAMACRRYHGPDGPGPLAPPVTIPDEGEGLVGDGVANPFPSALQVVEGRVALDVDTLPTGGATPLATARHTWRTGFSAGQTGILRGARIAAVGLPGVDAPPGTGTVRMADLTSGTWLPCLAELDAHPDAGDTPTLIVRPLVALADGHRIAVAITDEAMERPERFEYLMAGTPPASLAAYQATHDTIIDGLGALGLEPDRIALAWDFPVQHATRPLSTALAAADVPGTATLAVDATPRVPQAYKTAVGSFDVTTFLISDRTLSVDSTGAAQPVGDSTAHAYVHIPASVADAPAGTVPVLFFGHGIFASPEFYLDDPSDDNGVIALAEELGAIVVGTNWRGLTTPDLLDTTLAATDFARLAEVTDRLLQAQVNLRTLMLGIAQGDILDDPDLLGASGQVLFDPDQLYYYGISLGGIEGAVLWAEGGAPVDGAVLHVGGAMWSTMLERSSNWPLFEGALVNVVTDPADRQLLYSYSQLHWDAVDPISWVDALATKPFLLQESIGDEQVPNFATEVLARSTGLPLLEPSATQPVGLPLATGPLGRGLVQFDPEKALPPRTNRPAPETDAHTTPRDWAGQRQQVVTFLLEGEVRHYCGDAPCTPDNPGEP